MAFVRELLFFWVWNSTKRMCVTTRECIFLSLSVFKCIFFLIRGSFFWLVRKYEVQAVSYYNW